ncbi:TonB-dependent receptor [bacterium]|nr:TonB-dependent receptor [candidate division CSSED10-310 bacterium]
MKDRFLLLTAALILIGVAASTTHAALTGVITGKVTDNAGNALPGVEMTVSGEALQGDRQDFTNESGIYRFPEMPPGDYVIRAEMMGLKTIERTGVKVKVNTNTRINLKMEVAAIEETVVVTAEAAVIDTTSTTQTVNIDRDFTEKLPGNADYQDAITMVGGTVGGGNPQIHGGTKSDNVYLLDGVDTSDTLTGTFSSNVNPDALEEVEVQTGGFQAEYGRATGGIVNAVTKSGGNDFSLIFRMEYSNNTWQDDPFYATVEPAERELWVPTLSIGGPIKKDMLWFFVTARYVDVDDSLRVISGPYDDPRDPSGNVDTSDVGLYPYAKLTFQPSTAHKFVAKYNAEVRTIYGYDADVSVDPDATSDWEQGGPFYGLDWTWLFSQNTYLTTQVAYLNSYLDHYPTGEGLDRIGYYDDEDGIRWGAPEDYRYNDRNRTSASIALSHYMDQWIKGSHDWKFGLEWQDLVVKREVGVPGGIQYTYNDYQDGQDEKGWASDYYFDSYRTQTGGGAQEYTGAYYALFAQDGWEPGNGLTLNLGIRAETMSFENDTGHVTTETFSGTSATRKSDDSSGDFFMIAPRLGLAWDVGATGKHKLFAYLGRYYNPLDLQIPGALLETEPVYTTYRRKLADDTDRGNYDDRRYEWDDWREYEETGGAENTSTIDPDLKPEYSDEIQFGYEREISPNVSLGTTITYRATDDIVEDAGVWYEYDRASDEPTGRVFLAWDVPDGYRDNDTYRYELDHYWLCNPPDARRRYFGTELFMKASTERLNLLMSYTYSYAKGTVYGDQPVGAGGYSGSGTVTHFSVYYDTPELSKNLYGKLPYDVDYYFKINASYDFFPENWYAFSLGTSYFYRNGYAYSRRTLDPTYAGNYNVEEYGAGTYRLPSVSFMDLSVQKHFPFEGGKYGTLSVIFDIDNVFSSEYLLSRASEDKGTKRPWSFEQNSGNAGPRSYTLSFKYEI